MSTPSSPIDLDLEALTQAIETTTILLGDTPNADIRPATPFAQARQHAPFTDLFPPAAPSPPNTPCTTTATNSPTMTLLPTCPVCLDSPIKMAYPCRHATCLRCALEIWYTGVTKENVSPREFSCPMCRSLVNRMGVILDVSDSDEGGVEELAGVGGIKVSTGGWKSVHWWVGKSCDFLEVIEECDEEGCGEEMQG
ncbi:hypothetical protein HOY82DRAFT_538890 [Tuber indicum]|nr:hypothetical protein HOY82DRAFT_538890 [Tuber indicum]